MNNISQFLESKILKYIDINSMKSSIVETSNFLNIKKVRPPKKLNLIINLGLVNNIKKINKFHENVNENLDLNGIYLSCGETLEQRKNRYIQKSFFGLQSIYLFIDFIYKRVIPKLPFTKRIYFAITNGNNRVLSFSEIVGRLNSCGFEILDTFEYNNLLYLISKKIKKPDYNMNASYGPIFKMQRIGFGGKEIGLYKFRTMHPYSEYLQENLYKTDSLDKSGDKIQDDYRVTNWGKFLRKFWIDELPQFYNLIKGELNIIGVRAISKAKYDLYSDELKLLRIKVKPGLIPPYYADLPKNFDEFQQSEKDYIIQKLNNPLITDLKYFYKAFINIVVKGARSQ